MNFKIIIPILLVTILFLVAFLIELSRILKKKSCKIKIVGKLKNISIVKNNFRFVMETHIYFHYKYKGKEYTNICALDSDYISKKNRNKFTVGSEYSLYINPKKPENVCCSNRKYYIRDLLATGLMGFPALLSFIAIIEIIIELF